MQAMSYYDFNLTAGGTQMLTVEGAYFRIQSQTGAVDVTVEGVGTLPGLLTGQGLKDTPFKRLLLKDVSGASNSGQILVASREFIDNRTYGVNTLDTATLNALTRPLLPGANWKDTSTLVANTPLTIFTAAANVNGAILHSAYAQDISTVSFFQTLVAKATNPTGYTDGEIIVMSNYSPVTGNNIQNIKLDAPTRIAAGLGLYFVSSQNGTAGYTRAARYTLL